MYSEGEGITCNNPSSLLDLPNKTVVLRGRATSPQRVSPLLQALSTERFSYLRMEIFPHVSKLVDVHFDEEMVKALSEKMRPAKDESGGTSEVLELFDEKTIEAIKEKCESPIETQLGYALFLIAKASGIWINFIPYNVYGNLFISDFDPKDEERNALTEYYGNSQMLVIPNFTFNGTNGSQIRVDFLIRYKPKRGKHKFIIVECDSFQFHSTADQLVREKKRERELVQSPFKILRFAGREIYKNPSKAAEDILRFCFK